MGRMIDDRLVLFLESSTLIMEAQSGAQLLALCFLNFCKRRVFKWRKIGVYLFLP